MAGEADSVDVAVSVPDSVIAGRTRVATVGAAVIAAVPSALVSLALPSHPIAAGKQVAPRRLPNTRN